MTPLLQVTQLSKQFGDYPAITDISFEVVEGEILGLIGPNGSGKTTLMECVTGLLPYDRGTVFWQGQRLPMRRRRSQLFYLPDGILPYGNQSVIAMLNFFRQVQGASRRQQQRAIEQLGLEPVLTKRIQTLSKGYRRRFLLSLALLSPQPLLILDEPFDGFDLRQTLEVMDLLRTWRQQHTLLLSIHQLTDAEKICDRFLLLRQGRLIGSGALDALRSQAQLTTGSLEDIFLAMTEQVGPT